jgi:hypothetical protein
MRIIRLLFPLAWRGVFLTVVAGIALSAGAQTIAPNEWTWIGGSNTVPTSCVSLITNFAGVDPCGQPGVYGTLGKPVAGNIPGGRDSGATL